MTLSSLKKLKIIVTGSEGLLGKEISKYLEKKHQVYRLDVLLGHDLTNEDFVKKWFKKNKADCLINCFALNDHVTVGEKRRTLFDITLESFSKFLDVNLTALFSVCREFARNNKSGTIVNFSATTGIVSARPDLYNGGHKHPAYSVSKAGVINLTKFLATHLAPNFRVNCIAPGGVEHDQDNEFLKKYSKLTPMKRMMKKHELNELIELLCGPGSSYLTGATIIVDGGWTTW
ncbi:dehydrogenase [Candidatus Nitrosotenuis sp. DW1]|nr:dehydrogenase [Candidatus Nitrosotenuis sp. DW1]